MPADYHFASVSLQACLTQLLLAVRLASEQSRKAVQSV